MTSTCAMVPRILVADDQPALIDALRLLLKPEGILVEAVTSPAATLVALEAGGFDLLLMDLNYTGDTTSGREGFDLLAGIQALDRTLPVVVMTGWGSVDLAVEAMRRGVRDFVQKPWENDALVALLRREIALGREVRLAAARERRELEEARRIQSRLLPAVVPQMDGFEIAASWQPAEGVGGDCYDAIAFGSRRTALCIADVVGKGIPAALLMSSLQAAVRAFATESVQPGELCQQLNRILCGQVGTGRFISFVYCVIDVDHGTLTYANAGHAPPLLVRADRSIERLTAGGAVLGVLPEGTYDQGRIPLGPGDRLCLFTDGITGARNDEDEEFGEGRLAALAAAHPPSGAPALQACILRAVAEFSGTRLQDDATLIVLAAPEPAGQDA